MIFKIFVFVDGQLVCVHVGHLIDAVGADEIVAVVGVHPVGRLVVKKKLPLGLPLSASLGEVTNQNGIGVLTLEQAVCGIRIDMVI